MNVIPDYLTSPSDAGTLARLRGRLERAADGIKGLRKSYRGATTEGALS